MNAPGTPIAQGRDGPTFDSTIMSAMAAASLDALITIDGEGRILEFGPSAERIFGFRREEVLGQPIHEIVIPQRLRGAHQDGMRRYHATGHGPVLNTRVEVPAQRRDGTEFAAELTVIPIRVDGRDLFTAFVRDISERKEAEQARQRALEAAQQSDAAKSRFLAHMSHELRTPLTGVLGAAELLTDAPEPQRARLLRIVLDTGRSILQTVDHVLEYARVTSGSARVHSEPLALATLLEGLVDGSRERARARSIELTCSCDPTLPPQLLGDARHLQQVLGILLDNAIKFTPSGRVEVRARSVLADDARVQLRIEVEDSGVGMAPEVRARLFAPFAQADDSDRSAYGGAGLGLAIARALVEQMGGTIGCDSTPGQGSTFWIELALAVARDTAPHRDRSPGRELDPDEQAPLDLNVLLVEDTPSNQTILSAMLRRMGCAITVASNGAEALQRLREWPFDVVLMDLRMPVVDGLEATQRIRALEGPERSVPIIGLTANAFAEDERRCRDAGMDDYLTKPVRFRDLRSHLLAASRSSATRAPQS